MKKLKKEKQNKRQLIEIVSFIVIIIFSIIVISYVLSNYIRTKNDNNRLDEFFEIQEELVIEQEQNSQINENQLINSNTSTEKEIEEETPIEEYLGVLEINDINLKRGFYSINSCNNKLNKNIQVLKESKMPDEEKGNLIIAGHSGNSYISYFKNLHKLSFGSIANVYYKGKVYKYKLVNQYEIDKTGTAHIKRNAEKTVLTLITCKHNTNKQLLFIFELININ